MNTHWHTSRIPVEPSGVPWKRFLGEACPHGLKIAMVSGTYVRNHFDSDFSQGGNGFRYRFISRKEIWIDVDINPTERPFIAFHECTESEWMTKGLDYDRAHNRAKRQENKLRRQYDPG